MLAYLEYSEKREVKVKLYDWFDEPTDDDKYRIIFKSFKEFNCSYIDFNGSYILFKDINSRIICGYSASILSEITTEEPKNHPLNVTNQPVTTN